MLKENDPQAGSGWLRCPHRKRESVVYTVSWVGEHRRFRVYRGGKDIAVSHPVQGTAVGMAVANAQLEAQAGQPVEVVSIREDGAT